MTSNNSTLFIPESETEHQIELILRDMKESGRYVSLSLHPESGRSTIDSFGSTNVLYINEGRAGRWGDISERFYDLMVDMYDWSSIRNKDQIKF